MSTKQFCLNCGWQGDVCELALDCWQDSMVCPACKNKHVESRPNHDPLQEDLAAARAEVERTNERYLGVCRDMKKLEAENVRLREVVTAANRLLENLATTYPGLDYRGDGIAVRRLPIYMPFLADLQETAGRV